MYLISEDNFTRELSIPNLQSSQSGNAELLNLYADEKPRLLLQKCLGSSLFEEFDSQVTDGVLNEDADLKWQNLVNGCEYNGKIWKGLIYQEGSFNVSVLAYFTFWHWLNDLYSNNYQTQVKNAENINPTSTQVNVWNRFLKLYQGSLFVNNPIVRNINGVCFRDYFYMKESKYVSLLQFLQENYEDYPDAQLHFYKNSSNSNSLGL